MWIIANSCSVDYTVLYTHTTSRQNVPWCSFERPCSAARSMPYTLSAVKYVKLQQSQSGVYILHLQQSYHCLLILFSERELTFTFAICYRPSVCRLVCRLSVVCNARTPYSGGSNFPQYFYGIWYLGHPLTSTENFTEIVPEEPLRRGS